MRIGSRIAKTVIAVVLSIWTAELLQLEMATFAGIVATLLIQTTRRETLMAAMKLLSASMITLVVAPLLLSLFGFHLMAVGLMLLVIIPLLARTGTERGVVLSTVVCIHLYMWGHIQWSLWWNELTLILVGMAVATAVNLIYMPHRRERMQVIRQRLAEQSAFFLEELARSLEGDHRDWDGEEILRIHSLIKEGEKLARIHEGNYVTREDLMDVDDFRRKRQQFEHLKHMLVLVSRVEAAVVQGRMIAGLLRKAAAWLRTHRLEETGPLLKELETLRGRFEEMDLPVTREEFETRAALLQILHELRELIRKEE
ncbi:uncharacterized membrane protein YgaE (UPF0421/DUF939 family) [Melghirimyces profundicolus]|uniref:Uncharacterized membrane protein YgaE (UPF0421/DUF939 family) n=1 Tax=Melghirimyces profundicolus TaxID=1242148 RepID=A0A2T6BS37_9BACL|nr:aromatic acid exporter family protein [Melghirimyces profundicolus]PTX58905.1 uncharacterized membrane protein YgaE (UPF0421/DUF939 family) [Melghirimyces profundicolus]